MRLLHTLLLFTVTLHWAIARKRPRPNPVMGALQNILSPANAERTMQMVQFAAQRLGNVPTPLQYAPPMPPPCNQPPVPIQYPPLIPPPCIQPPVPVQYAPQIPQPCNQPTFPIQYSPLSPQPCNQPPIPIQYPPTVPPPCNQPLFPYPQSECNLPTQHNLIPQMPVQLPMPQLPTTMPVPMFQRQPEVIFEQQKEIIYPVERSKPCACQREIVYPSIEMPYAPEPLQELYNCPIPTPAALFNPPVPPPAIFNPYLPAASPVSCWTQENLPTATSGTRSQYLRKIPIPPPTL